MAQLRPKNCSRCLPSGKRVDIEKTPFGDWTETRPMAIDVVEVREQQERA
jgi:hypothetical protein